MQLRLIQLNWKLTIKKLLSSLLIFLLALGLTPKILLHNFLADHKDSCFDNHSLKGDQVTKEGYNCSFENLVAESPFISEDLIIETSQPEANTRHISFTLTDYLLHLSHYAELRGPPTMG
ncbi:MAG: hypothetical protein ACJ748_11690 [Flavisolibacter sp.]